MWNLSSPGISGNNLLKSHVTNRNQVLYLKSQPRLKNRAGVAALCTLDHEKVQVLITQALDVIPNYTKESFGRTQTAWLQQQQ